MTEHALQAMNYIDPILIERVELSGTVRQRLPLHLRTAVIAACVCMTLLGTVGAVGRLMGVFKGDKVQVGTEFMGYTYQLNGIEAVPREAFRAGFLDAIEEKEDGKLAYLNREALQEDMGFRLAENSILQQMFQGRCAIRTWSSGLSLWELYVGEDVTIDLKAEIYFSIDTSALSEPSSWSVYKGIDTSAEHYTMPDGSTALILTTTTLYQGEEYTHFDSRFIRDGILYSVSVSADPGQREEVRVLLEDILDAFS